MKPIAFSRPMVLARRSGRKTQTRRIIKPQPKPNQVFMSDVDRFGKACAYFDDGLNALVLEPPYGQPGEQLWVREDFQVLHRISTDASRRLAVRYQADELRADVTLTEHELALWNKRQFPYRATPGRFMYQSLARDKPTLLGVRVERLQDITEEDAIAEGIEQFSHRGGFQIPFPDGTSSGWQRNPRDAFRQLWSVLHGYDSWNANPHVWVLTLSKFQPA